MANLLPERDTAQFEPSVQVLEAGELGHGLPDPSPGILHVLLDLALPQPDIRAVITQLDQIAEQLLAVAPLIAAPCRLPHQPGRQRLLERVQLAQTLVLRVLRFNDIARQILAGQPRPPFNPRIDWPIAQAPTPDHTQ